MLLTYREPESGLVCSAAKEQADALRGEIQKKLIQMLPTKSEWATGYTLEQVRAP